MKYLFLFLMISCSKSEAVRPLFFDQEVLNYGIVRYDNQEVICYEKGQAFTCLKKD